MTKQERRRAMQAVCDRTLLAMRAVSDAYRYADSTSPDPERIPDLVPPPWAAEAGIEFVFGASERTLTIEIKVPHLVLQLDSAPHTTSGHALANGYGLSKAAWDWPFCSDIDAVMILDRLTGWLNEHAAKVRREADQAAATSERLARYREIVAAAMIHDVDV